MAYSENTKILSSRQLDCDDETKSQAEKEKCGCSKKGNDGTGNVNVNVILDSNNDFSHRNAKYPSPVVNPTINPAVFTPYVVPNQLQPAIYQNNTQYSKEYQTPTQAKEVFKQTNYVPDTRLVNVPNTQISRPKCTEEFYAEWM